MSDPIVLTNLVAGVHQLSVIGKNDAALYQNDPLLGANAVVTRSRSWTVQAGFGIAAASISGGELVLRVVGAPGTSYRLESSTALNTPSWSEVQDVTTDQNGSAQTAAGIPNDAARFYRLRLGP